jgi:hypothetical protein
VKIPQIQQRPDAERTNSSLVLGVVNPVFGLETMDFGNFAQAARSCFVGGNGDSWCQPFSIMRNPQMAHTQLPTGFQHGGLRMDAGLFRNCLHQRSAT